MPCYEYLKTCFGDRIDLIKGPSEEVLPKLLATNNTFDSYFIDGGHKPATVNVLEDEEIRNGIKEYSNWPTIPQLYIKGEFIGGSDIMTEMFQNGELQQVLGTPEA